MIPRCLGYIGKPDQAHEYSAGWAQSLAGVKDKA